MANSAFRVTPVCLVISFPTSSCMLLQFGLASAPKKVRVTGAVSSPLELPFVAPSLLQPASKLNESVSATDHLGMFLIDLTMLTP
ncbi:hypothetical protein D3C76_1475210 [compost metagenome]